MISPDKNGWLPIDSAPKDGTTVLLFERDELAGDNHSLCVHLGAYDSGHWVEEDLIIFPAYWQPLPGPLESGEAE